MFKRLFFLIILLLSFGGAVLAQNTISGTVFFEIDQEPAVGVAVKVVGTQTGTTTDMDGKFQLQVKAGTKLQFTCVGMESQTLPAKNGMKVMLKDNAQTFDQVVVTGMQLMDKRLFTGATTKVDAAKVKMDGVADISRSLEGRVAGVSVQNVSGTFGTAPKIRVRGATSIYGSSKPLWVVDGVIMEDVTEVDADELSSGDAETVISSAIAGINADDIESFQILKDGSATSIYGARAMAGVIVVTTKKGKAGTSRLSYTGEYTTRLKPTYSQFNIMNSQEQMGVYKEMEANGLISLARTYRSQSSGVYGKMYHLINSYDAQTGFGLANTAEAQAAYLQAAEMRNTDWFDELFHTNIVQNHSVSLSTGSDKAQYYTSLSVMDDPGWTEASKVQRYTANLNALYNVNKRTKLNFISSASYRKQRAPGTTSQYVDPVSGEVSRDFDINPYSYAMNTSRTLDPNEYYTRNYADFNIHNELQNNYMDYDVLDLKLQGEAKFKPVKSVELAAIYAYKVSNTVQDYYIKDNSNMAMAFRAMDDATMQKDNPWLYQNPDNQNSLPVSVLPKGGFFRETKFKMNSWNARFTAAYNDAFNDKHIVNAFGGMEVSNTDRTRTYFDGVGMQYDMGYLGSYDYLYFKQSVEQGEMYYSLDNSYNRDVAFFGTATYSYDGIYTLNGTLRYEGSNRLGKSRKARWLPTWNISAAWNAHEEKWFKALFNDWFSHATVKASYSLTGDKPATTNSQVIVSSYSPWRPFTADQVTGLQISSIANPDLTYEKKHEFNLGVDLGFLNNRINVQFDWYKRNNFDLIGAKTTNGTLGVVTQYANVASMKSSGEELSVSTRNIIGKKFQWTTDFIFSHVKTEVTELKTNSNIISMITGNGFTMEGYPYRSLFSIDYQGLNESGIPTFLNEYGELTTSDINFQSRLKDYLVYEGPTDPTITGSLNNSFTFGNWHANIYLTYSMGNVVRMDAAFHAAYTDLDAMPKEFKNRWTVAGDENYTDVPAIADLRTLQEDSNLAIAYNAYNMSTARTASGDFVRLKEVNVSYDFPQKVMDFLHVKALSAKIQASNICLLYADKKLNGQDPEFINSGGVAMPTPRQFTFTLRLGI